MLVFKLLMLNFLFFLRFYILIHERHGERQRHREREKQFPHGEPDVGLILGGCPEPKADAQPLSHPGIPMSSFFFFFSMSSFLKQKYIL